MIQKLLYFAVLALLFGPYAATASSTLVSEEKGVVVHKESGWSFPKTVGKMKQKVKPSIIPGTDDIGAIYETGKGDSKIQATIIVYSSKSVATDATYEVSQMAITANLRGPISMAQLWSEGPFTVGAERKLMGRKSFYKSDLGPTSIAELLYYFDTGPWIVKIRVTGRENAKSYEIGDQFVQSLPWGSLHVSGDQCTGYSCTIERPVAIHGMIPEMLAQLYTEKHNFAVEESGPECSSTQIVESLSADPKLNAKGLAMPVEKVANCRLGDSSIGFVRFVLPPDMLERLVTSPDGLTLSGPFTFAMVKKKDDLELAELHDGPMDTKTMNEMLGRIKDDNFEEFAVWNLKDGTKRPVIRFIE